MSEHQLLANDLANALTLARPGDLSDALEECTPEELALVARIVRQMDAIREIKIESDPWRIAGRAVAARRKGLE